MKKILIIEDDMLLNNLLKIKFQKEGFEVSGAFDGREGIEKIRTEHPDLVLLDLILPIIDGFEVLKQVKQDEAIANIPIIIVSNLGSSEDVERGMGMGVVDYIVKSDLTLDQIAIRVKEFLGKLPTSKV